MAEPLPRRKVSGAGKRMVQRASPSPSLGTWISASDNHALAHRAVLRLTYGITPAVGAMSIQLHRDVLSGGVRQRGVVRPGAWDLPRGANRCADGAPQPARVAGGSRPAGPTHGEPRE